MTSDASLHQQRHWCPMRSQDHGIGHQGHVYYRRTHRKGGCSQSGGIREAELVDQVEELLSRIEIDAELIAALADDARTLDAQEDTGKGEQVAAVKAVIEANQRRSGALLDSAISREVYGEKRAELGEELRGFERRLAELQAPPVSTYAQVEELARTAASARVTFAAGDTETRRKVLSTVGLNLGVRGGCIASHQYKRPFGILEKDSSGRSVLHGGPS